NGDVSGHRAHLGEHIQTGPIGQIQIENDHVESALAKSIDCLGARVRLSRHADISRLGENLLDSVAHDVVIVDDEHSNHDAALKRSPAGMRTDTIVPLPAMPSKSALPPIIAARSRMPISPSDLGLLTSSEVMPRPSSRISTKTSPPASCMRISTRDAFECRTTF